MARIGIYGGTFDPPHMGHVCAAREAVRALGLDLLLVIPDRIPPHKERPADAPSPEQRLEMTKLAFAGDGKIRVTDLELRREGKSYTYETVEQLRAQYPDDELILLMGTDMFLSFHQWKYPERILAHVSLAVFYRGDKGEKDAVAARKAEMEAQGHEVLLVQNPVVEISSTSLRRMLVFRCAGPFLPEGVGDYIHQNGLYGTGRDYRGLPMEELEPVVLSLLKKSRVAHVLGCRDTCVALAERWGADRTDAGRAGMLHDVTKALDGPLQLTLCQEYGTILDDFGKKYPKTLHALTGALVAERIFGEGEPVVTAIRHHTTGRGHMGLLEKIVYVADYMEPNRDFPGVDRLRELAFSDIDAALKLGLEFTLEHLKRLGDEVSPESREALAWLDGKR
ncbi:MAG: nicotinate (nicotinamide) nucleotide adenylyltransferase [Oscillospiraceae bacterium]|nr:nicotinate (nicotinamide) nucleotide adenylyltransferase [Oscillospiraceae bacterium]